MVVSTVQANISYQKNSQEFLNESKFDTTLQVTIEIPSALYNSILLYAVQYTSVPPIVEIRQHLIEIIIYITLL